MSYCLLRCSFYHCLTAHSAITYHTYYNSYEWSINDPTYATIENPTEEALRLNRIQQLLCIYQARILRIWEVHPVWCIKPSHNFCYQHGERNEHQLGIRRALSTNKDINKTGRLRRQYVTYGGTYIYGSSQNKVTHVKLLISDQYLRYKCTCDGTRRVIRFSCILAG